MGALDLVERVAEIDLQQPELGSLVCLQTVSQGMCNNFHSSWAAHSIVAASKRSGDIFFPGCAKTLGDQTANGVNGRTAVADFSSAIDTPPATNRFKKFGARPDAK